MTPLPLGGQCEEDNGLGCHETAATAQERDGVHRPGSPDQPLLHRHPQHHPGRGGPHPGKRGPITLASGPQRGEKAATTSLPTLGPQESAEDPGKEVGQLRPLGPSQHPGGPVKEVPLPAISPPGQRAHDGQPHQYLLGEQSPVVFVLASGKPRASGMVGKAATWEPHPWLLVALFHCHQLSQSVPSLCPELDAILKLSSSPAV